MATLQDIRNKVRLLTGRKSTVQLSDAQIDFQINNYYLYNFPLEFRSWDLRTELSIITQPNVAVYPQQPNVFQSFEPMAYVEGYPTIFTEDRSTFHKLFPDIRNDSLVAQANGTAGPYNGFCSGSPIIEGSVMVYANTSFNTAVNCLDDSAGNLRDSLPNGTIRGTIDYATGAINITFGTVIPTTVPPNNTPNEVRVQSRQYSANRPTTVFYFDNQIILRPVPDRCYQILIIAYLLPTAMDTANPASTPFLNEWWEVLAYGASLKILENNKDMEGVKDIATLLDNQFLIINRRQWFQMHSQRTSTIYSQPILGSNPSMYFGYFGGVW